MDTLDQTLTRGLTPDPNRLDFTDSSVLSVIAKSAPMLSLDNPHFEVLISLPALGKRFSFEPQDDMTPVEASYIALFWAIWGMRQPFTLPPFFPKIERHFKDVLDDDYKSHSSDLMLVRYD